MNQILVLDSHIWVWWVEGISRLPKLLADRIETGAEGLAISSVSVYEVSLQVQRGRIAIGLPLDEWLHEATVESSVSILEVNSSIARQAALLPLHHGDPLDRVIIATTLYHDTYLASVDTHFPKYQELNGRLLNGKLG